MNKHILFFVLSILTWSTAAFSQNYPVHLTTQLVPPFSGYLPDYTTPGDEKLKALVLFTDFTKPSYNIKLKIKIQGQGITIQSKAYYFEGPFMLQPGVPLEISCSELGGLLNSNNLDFTGISKNDYEQRKVLPEGYYSVCITAYDFNNPVPIQVSNEACAFAWMVLSDPPFLNLPSCGTQLTVNNPQQITFNWTQMNMGSPNSAANTEYVFELWELRPNGAVPNNVIQTIPPVFTYTTNITTLYYGITETPLIKGLEYVWRVRAVDIHGRDLFKNNGYSQACTFKWGSIYDGAELNINLNAQAVTHRQARLWWDSIAVFDTYILEFRKVNGNGNWFPAITSRSSYRIADLEPETDYEARVQGSNSQYTGQYSNTAPFRTPAAPVINCGDVSVPPNMQNFKPLTQATTGMIWQVGQFEMVVTQLNNAQDMYGKYSGLGRVTLPWGGINARCSFQNITMNDEQVMVAGEVKVLSDGITNWVNQWQNNQNMQYDSTYIYNGTIDSVYVNSNGQVVIVGTNGVSTTLPAGTNNGGVLIQDSNGNQWVVSSNGTVTPVIGGGLMPVNNDPLTSEERDILKTVLQLMKAEYTSSTISSLKTIRDQKEQSLQSGINSQRQNITITPSATSEDGGYIGFMEEDSNNNSAVLQQNIAFKEAEENLNVAKVAYVFSKQELSNEQLNFIGHYLSVSGKPFKDYVKQEKQAGTSLQNIAVATKTFGLVELIKLVVKKKMKHD